MLSRTGIHDSGLMTSAAWCADRRALDWRHRAVQHLPQRRRILGGDRRQPGHRVRPAVHRDGRPELATDDRFATHGARGRNQDELDKIIAAWAAERQPGEIVETLSAAGVIAGPINTVAEVVEDPQLRAAACLSSTTTNGSRRSVLGPGVVPVLSESPGGVRNAGSARPGQHNDDVYAGLLGKRPRSLRSCAPRRSYDTARRYS